MKQMTVKKVVALSVLSCSAAVFAREIRTPLPVPITAYYHYPLFDDHDDAAAPKMDGSCEELPAYGSLFGAVYNRTADKAFSCKDGTCKVPFVNLLFGQSSFTVAQAFPGSSVGYDLPTNPFVTVSTVAPRFDYNERGAVLGGSVGTCWCDGHYHCGFRARIPVRDIDVREVPGASDWVGETIDDLFRIRIENNPDTALQVQSTFAARLDLLSALLQSYPTGSPMVNWSVNPLRIANENVAEATGNGMPIVAVIGSPSGEIPWSSVWAKNSSAITANVAADGSGVGNGTRGRFDPISYAAGLGINQPVQSTLFVVPTLLNDNQTIIDGANNIRNMVSASLAALPTTSVRDFFVEKGFNVWDGRTKGLGDLDIDYFVNKRCGCCRQFLGELQVGVRLPTAEKLCSCKNLLKQPLGNNGHVECRLGALIGWDASDTFKLSADAAYSYVCGAKETIPATFVGATIKNIGPCVEADISWKYVTCDVILSVFANRCCGFDVGYQYYGKSHDQVCYCVESMYDLAGRANQLLDPSVAQCLTTVHAHKVHGELFTSLHSCELFGGFNFTFAGKNAPRDTDCYLGMRINF